MIVLAYDHGAAEMFKKIKRHLDLCGLEYVECASPEYDALDSFATFAIEANALVKKGYIGIYGCRSGIGMSMASNKARGVRGALCFKPLIAEMSRKHNDANVCIIPCDYIGSRTAINIVDKFLNTEFLGGKYQERVEQVDSIQ